MLKPRLVGSCPSSSAGLGQVWNGHAVLNLGVSDRAVLLSEVESELALVAKVQVAFLTMVRLLSCVDAKVALEGLQVSEASPADLTGVRLLSCVDQHVSTQVSNLYKACTTGFTFVWLFS